MPRYLLAIFLLPFVLLNGCAPRPQSPSTIQAVLPSFATYQEVAVNTTPQVPSYSVSHDLSNISNASDFTFSPAAQALLIKNAFVVTPGQAREFYPLYEDNRYNYVPNFVTADSLLHNYHLVFDHLLRKLEEGKLSAELKDLSREMLAESLKQYELLKNTGWANAARRNVGFFAVGSQLLDPSFELPPFAQKEVKEELVLIAAHQGLAESPVMNLGTPAGPKLTSPQGPLGLEELKEDYSQYLPRGHYTKSAALQAYFKAMMWYGRLTFRLKNEDEIKSALLITRALEEKKNQQSWNNIYETVGFFVCQSDDLTYCQFAALMNSVYGTKPPLRTLSSSPDKLTVFIKAAKALPPPQINSIPIFNQEIQPDRDREIKGFRFLGQKFTVDALIFQQLVDRAVPGRMLPTALDIPAALGSDSALKLLGKTGATGYQNYSANLASLVSYLTTLPTATWTQNLYWSWLYTLRPLLDVPVSGYPAFMTNPAWALKQLNTFLGSWTELKHDTLLYSKQVYAELGGGDLEAKDDRGYVEPAPYVYARLTALLNLTRDGLAQRNLLDDKMKEALEKMSQLSLSLKTISEKELNNQALSDAEYELIRSYGGQLEHFWLEVNREEMAATGVSQMIYLDQNPAAIVADVATDPNGSVLEEAIGYISEIYVVVPVDGKLRLAKGGIFSYYEFTQPLADRLTDQAWRTMLEEGKAPPSPAWTGDFTSN